MSSSTAQPSATKARSYRLGKRAEKQEATRRRIVEAAVDLHCSLGPARTTVSQIAERAGVQRHTFYAHFPDERSLFLACSGYAMERDPLPDVEALAAIAPGEERLRRGLEDFYRWFDRNAEQSACVLRDAQYHPLTREMVELRMAPVFARAAELLGEGLEERSRALLGVALDFSCWQRLSDSHTPASAATLMSEAIVGVGQERAAAD